jgi:formate hydrogenlyase subunit 4
MSVLLPAVHLLLVLAMPIVLVGVVNRTKSWWVGRRGPGILQSAWDLRRLLGKRAVLSHTASVLFRSGPYVVVLASLLAACMLPMLGRFAPLQFDYDFVLVAYALGLARIVMMLCALDVGSAFEGMGAAREASFASFAEPGLFLLLGTACAATGQTSFAAVLGDLQASPFFAYLVLPLLLGLFILLQTEAARVPVDDPLTHLELTMVHEVMLLDHSGPELAAMQYAAALKMTLYAGLMATLLNPFDPTLAPLSATLASVALMLGVAVAVGCVESLTARLPMRWVGGYVLLASAMGLVGMALVGLLDFGVGGP